MEERREGRRERSKKIEDKRQGEREERIEENRKDERRT